MFGVSTRSCSLTSIYDAADSSAGEDAAAIEGSTILVHFGQVV